MNTLKRLFFFCLFCLCSASLVILLFFGHWYYREVTTERRGEVAHSDVYAIGKLVALKKTIPADIGIDGQFKILRHHTHFEFDKPEKKLVIVHFEKKNLLAIQIPNTTAQYCNEFIFNHTNHPLRVKAFYINGTYITDLKSLQSDIPLEEFHRHINKVLKSCEQSSHIKKPEMWIIGL